MSRAAFVLAMSTLACGGAPPDPSSDAPVCLPYVGAYEAPPLPVGAGCFEAHVSDPSALVLLVRGAPECGASTIGSCSLPGCAAVGSVYPGDIVDVWGTPPDPRMVVAFVPQVSEYCL